MKLLFDQGTPAPLRRHLDGHVVDTAAERGWSDLDNGDLIENAEREGYDDLITTRWRGVSGEKRVVRGRKQGACSRGSRCAEIL